MRLIAAITEESVARQSLESLALPPRAPPDAPANAIDLGPDSGDRAFEEAFVEGQSDPGLDFDRSAGDDPFATEDS